MRLLLLGVVCALTMQAATHYITIAGLGGEADFDQRFTGWAQTIDQVLRASRTDAKIDTLTGKDATRDRLREVLATAAQDCGPDDAIVLMIIGHGTFDGEEYKIALPGPDISGSELATLLNRVRAKRQLVVNMTSSS